ncbi:O-unit flippase, partial [bacterium LRH843]|nr:O-unit flippase [bacterium LRH843]
MVISLWNTINSFILIWLNEEQLLDSLTIGLILVNLYIFLMRGSVDRFKEAGGIFYQDRYAPLIEGAVNIVASLVLVKVMGLSGIFLGTLISNIA